MSIFEVPVDETELLLKFLQMQGRDIVVAKVDGLTEEQARWVPAETANPLVGLINHLAHVERRWIDSGFLGGPRVRDPEELRPPELTVADAVARYRDAWAHTDEVVRAHSLDEISRREDADLTLRWIVLHLIEETARHAGHADITRELIDGTVGE